MSDHISKQRTAGRYLATGGRYRSGLHRSLKMNNKQFEILKLKLLIDEIKLDMDACMDDNDPTFNKDYLGFFKKQLKTAQDALNELMSV